MLIRHLILAILRVFMVLLGLSMAVVLTAPKSHAAVVVRSSSPVIVRTVPTSKSTYPTHKPAMASQTPKPKTHSSTYKRVSTTGGTSVAPNHPTKLQGSLMSFELECTHQPNTAGVYTCILEDD